MNTEQYHEPGQYSVFDEVREPLLYAATGQRFVNYRVDTVIMYLFIIFVFFIIGLVQAAADVDIMGSMMDDNGEAGGMFYFVFLLLFVLSYTLIEGLTRGRSIGKYITGTKAVTEAGNTISWNDALKRSLCRLIPFEQFSGLGGHPWHDTVTKTVVIKTRR